MSRGEGLWQGRVLGLLLIHGSNSVTAVHGELWQVLDIAWGRWDTVYWIGIRVKSMLRRRRHMPGSGHTMWINLREAFLDYRFLEEALKRPMFELYSLMLGALEGHKPMCGCIRCLGIPLYLRSDLCCWQHSIINYYIEYDITFETHGPAVWDPEANKALCVSWSGNIGKPWHMC
jgi:hypothetical protein